MGERSLHRTVVRPSLLLLSVHYCRPITFMKDDINCIDTSCKEGCLNMLERALRATSTKPSTQHIQTVLRLPLCFYVQTRQQAIDILLTSDKDISKLDFNGQRVLMRADFNVPISGNRIADDTRWATRYGYFHESNCSKSVLPCLPRSSPRYSAGLCVHRIRATIPTIHLLLEKGAILILCSHLGR